jgi:hypothetical protein
MPAPPPAMRFVAADGAFLPFLPLTFVAIPQLKGKRPPALAQRLAYAGRQLREQSSNLLLCRILGDDAIRIMVQRG